MRAALLLLIAVLPQWAAEISGSVNLWKPYLDEGSGFAAGASVRIPLIWRLSVRPEVVGGNVQTDRRLMALVSGTLDMTDPKAAAVGYLVGSVGLSQVRDGYIRYTSREPAYLLGAGVRYKMGSRVVGGVEFRVGFEAAPLITATVGYRFGK